MFVLLQLPAFLSQDRTHHSDSLVLHAVSFISVFYKLQMMCTSFCRINGAQNSEAQRYLGLNTALSNCVNFAVGVFCHLVDVNLALGRGLKEGAGVPLASETDAWLFGHHTLHLQIAFISNQDHGNLKWRTKHSHSDSCLQHIQRWSLDYFNGRKIMWKPEKRTSVFHLVLKICNVWREVRMYVSLIFLFIFIHFVNYLFHNKIIMFEILFSDFID